MTDPINNPVTMEDEVYKDDGPQKFDLPPSRKEERARLVEQIKERERNELATVLATDAGKAVIMRILSWCNLYRADLMTEAEQGRRVLGARLVHHITELGPAVYPQLLVDHAKRTLLQAQVDEAAASKPARH